jgi:hypothetical protein
LPSHYGDQKDQSAEAFKRIWLDRALKTVNPVGGSLFYLQR